MRTDVAAHEAHAAPCSRGALHALAGARQHRRRAIDADERHAGARQRDGDATRAAAELEHRCRRRSARRCARTARRAVPAYGRSPSRRTARTRPSLRDPRPAGAAGFGWRASWQLAAGRPASGRPSRRASCSGSRRTPCWLRPLRCDRRRAPRGTPSPASLTRSVAAPSSPAPRAPAARVHTSSGGTPSCTLVTGNMRTSTGFDAGTWRAGSARAVRRRGASRRSRAVGHARRRTASRPASASAPDGTELYK